MACCMEEAKLEHSDSVLMVHPRIACTMDGPCTIHNRSNHHMRAFPQSWRGDRGIMERVCPHGIGHPDPDDVRIRNGSDSGIHGCDGCCIAPKEK